MGLCKSFNKYCCLLLKQVTRGLLQICPQLQSIHRVVEQWQLLLLDESMTRASRLQYFYMNYYGHSKEEMALAEF